MNEVKALVFDLYGTLINIRTDEGDPQVYVELSKFLSYNQVDLSPEDLRGIYNEEIQRQLRKSREQYPEVDVWRVFSFIVSRHGSGRLDVGLAVQAARLFRSLTRKYFEPFSGVFSMLERLRESYPMALLSDAQRCFSEPEIKMLRLNWFFDHIYFSSDYGFRKPDSRYFGLPLKALGVSPEEAVYIGDNPFRDLFGAKKAGMKMVLVRSEEQEYEGFRPDFRISEITGLEGVIKELTT